MIRTFWEKNRPSSSDDETEFENLLQENIETVKDLDLSKNELKSEIRKLEYEIQRYQTNFKNQEKIISRLKREYETMKNKSKQETTKLRNELVSLKERYYSISNCKSFCLLNAVRISFCTKLLIRSYICHNF